MDKFFERMQNENFQKMQQFNQQQFEHSENSRILTELKAQNDELVRTLKQYNDLVEKNNLKIEEREKEQQAEMKKLEKSRTVWTWINAGIALAGIIASALNGIFF